MQSSGHTHSSTHACDGDGEVVTRGPGSHCPIAPHESLEFVAEMGSHSSQLVWRRMSVKEEPRQLGLVDLTTVFLSKEGVNQSLMSGTATSTATGHGDRRCA